MKSVFARLMLQKKYIFLILRVNIRDFFRADYLKRKGSEVVNMLTAEYDYETDIEIYLRSQQNMIELADILTTALLER